METPAAGPAAGSALTRPNWLRRDQLAPRPGDDITEESQLAGVSMLISMAEMIPLTDGLQAIPLAPPEPPGARKSGPRLLMLFSDPAVRGALALIASAVLSGGLGYVFWAVAAHYQKATAVGADSAEVSAITFLAAMGSLNLINVFARFLPEAGWHARRMVLISYGAALMAGSLFAVIFLLTPLSSGLIIGGNAGRLAFVACVVLTSVFVIQDGGLVGFGRPGLVPVENILVALLRLGLLPLGTMLLAARVGILWAWAIPMVFSVLIVNSFSVGKLAPLQGHQRPKLPPVPELTRFIAIESVTTAVTAAVDAFLPALVTRRLGAAQGAYFYVPWIVTTMTGLLLTSILISMVRESVAHPDKASATIRRSLRLIGPALVVGVIGCLFLSGLVLNPLGHEYAVYGTPVLRWTGLALPAMAVNYLFWATCLTRKRPWPVFALNFSQSIGIIAGVMLLGHGSDIGDVGRVFCLVEWAVAAAVSIPTYRAVRSFGKH